MNVAKPNEFKHTTATTYPDKVVGVVFLEEAPGFTGIYLKGGDGKLWPARTVNRQNRAHHKSVCQSWKKKYPEVPA